MPGSIWGWMVTGAADEHAQAAINSGTFDDIVDSMADFLGHAPEAEVAPAAHFISPFQFAITVEGPLGGASCHVRLLPRRPESVSN